MKWKGNRGNNGNGWEWEGNGREMEGNGREMDGNGTVILRFTTSEPYQCRVGTVLSVQKV